MYLTKLKDCEKFISADGCILREILHPDKMDIDLRYSLAHAILPVGEKSTPHKLKHSEVYYIIQGKGLMHIAAEEFEVTPEATVYIPPNALQYIENIGDIDLVFVCIVDPAWKEEDEEVL